MTWQNRSCLTIKGLTMHRSSLLVSIIFGFCPLTLAFIHGFGSQHSVWEFRPAEDNILNTQTSVSEHWFKQKLDHFNPGDNRYWQQRYYINDTFYQQGGPAFLYIGPETPLPEIFARTGSWLEYAKFYHAIGFAVEHRYYGKSHPTADLSMDNLKYLTVEQALEDLAAFISTTKKQLNLTDVKWVTFGGSYAGMLSAWMRYKFPHLVSGAIAHSAPVAVPISAPEYTVWMGEDLRTVPGCYEAVHLSFDDIRDKLRSSVGAKRLGDLFRMCNFDISKTLDVENVMFTLMGPLKTTTQNNDVHIKYMRGGVKLESVSDLCSVLTDKTRGPPLERLADFTRISTQNYTALNGSCLDVSFDSVLDKGKKLSYGENLSVFHERQWGYQACTQIGVFITTESDNQLFGNVLSEDYYFKVCEGYFGSNLNKSILSRGHEDILMNYGGLGILATNVVYTQGSFDPWHKYGFIKDPNPRAHTILIKGVGHVADLYSSSPLDNADLKQARKSIQRYIGQWISSRNFGVIG